MTELLSHSLTPESREICGFRGGYSSKATTCCPTAFQKRKQVQPLPKSRANQGEKPGKAASPARKERLIAQQQVAKQGTPDLPAHSISTVTKKIREFESLLDLLEEYFDIPATTIKVGDAACAPLHIVCQELHFPLDTVNLDKSAHTAHAFRVFPFVGRFAREHDFLVGQDLWTGDLAALEDGEAVAALGASDPEDSAQEEVVEVVEVHIGLVEDDNLAGLHARTDLSGSLGIVVAGGVNQGECGQEALEVEPHVALGCRLAPSVLGPVHAFGDQFKGCGIHNVDRPAKPVRHTSAPPSASKFRRERLEMREHGPENLLHQHCLALLARVGESVTARRGRTAKCRERAAMKPQRVTYVIEADRVSQLRVEHRDHMAPGRKCPAGFVHPGLSRQLRHEMGRNEIAELSQNAELGCRWAGLVFHPLPSGRFSLPRPSLLQLFHLLCGTAVHPICYVNQ